MRISISATAQALARWLFNPVPLWKAIRVDYRRPFHVATILFLASAVAGFVAGTQDTSGWSQSRGELIPGMIPGDARIEAVVLELAVREVESRDFFSEASLHRHASESWEDRYQGAMDAGRREEAMRLMLEEASRQLARGSLHGLFHRGPPNMSEVFQDVWLAILITFVVDTLACVGLGFLFGLYPAGRTAFHGVALGYSLALTYYVRESQTFQNCLWFLPVWIVLVFGGILSAAIGLGMAKYIVQPDKGPWFQEHVYKGLKTWWTAVVPLFLLALAYLAVTFIVLVVQTGDPTIRFL